MLSPHRLVHGRYAHVQGFYLGDKRGDDDYAPELVNVNGHRRFGLRWALRRRTASGKLTHELRFWHLGAAKQFARDRFGLTLPQTCELRAGKTVKVRGATLRITRR